MINQESYINQLKEKYCPNATPVSIPMLPSLRLSKSTEPDMSLPYREIVGALMFIAQATRPDINFAVSTLCRYFNYYDKTHLKAAIQVLRYLIGTSKIGLVYHYTNTAIIARFFSDSSFGDDIDTRKSTTGVLGFIGACCVIWISQLQKGVSLSTLDAEYYALSRTTQEAIWLRTLLSELGFNMKSATPIAEDNVGATSLANNPVIGKRSKHIDIRYHFTREHVKVGNVVIVQTPSKDQLADNQTKAQALALLKDHRGRIMGKVTYIYIP